MTSKFHKDVEGDGETGVHIRYDDSQNPVVIATFDGEKRVSEWRAALQEVDEVEFAHGYAKGKDEYTENESRPPINPGNH